MKVLCSPNPFYGASSSALTRRLPRLARSPGAAAAGLVAAAAAAGTEAGCARSLSDPRSVVTGTSGAPLAAGDIGAADAKLGGSSVEAGAVCVNVSVRRIRLGVC